jgi:hypothetical protein
VKRKPVNDDFEEEIRLQRLNKDFMRLLDERGKESATISAEDARKQLGLPPRRRRQQKRR